MMLLGVDLLGFIFGALCASWAWYSVSFPMLGNFSAMVSSNKFSSPLSPSFPLETPIMHMLGHLMLSQSSPNLSPFKKILSSASSSLMFIPSSVFLFALLSSSSLFLSVDFLCLC